MPIASQPVPAVATTGGFLRQQAAFASRITLDGSSGFPAEPGRYQLYASLADPWSHRALIVRRLLGLERVIGLTLTDPIPGERGWRFPDASGGRDPVTGATWLAELYLATDPAYAGRCTVPLIWDVRTQRISVPLDDGAVDLACAQPAVAIPAEVRRVTAALGVRCR